MIELECGAWSATVATHGGGLVALRQHGRDVVVPQDGDGSHPAYSGAVLAPWPNRLEDGVYTFEGVTYEVPINEPEAATALHGLVHDIAWTVAAATPESVRLTVEVPRSAGFPFTVRLDLDYVLSSGGLNVALTATNAGDAAAPYGCGFHPYLVLDEGDETPLWIPAESYLETTPVRHLPLRRKEVAGSPYDFGSTRPLGSTVLDYAYTDLRRDETGEVVVRVGGTEVRCGPGVLWLQAYTPEGRGSLAVEPCSSPANAFRSGHDLVVLQPGSRHVLTWTIRRP
ncbi:galactose mutarotase [Mumia sp. zg.B21]|uniref:aldose epimerase family protein n=1 Tax=Mumia sp. zg.B21 TaxID=2855447 RepID=UPI001C6E0C47|nr:galactose mutarotase [Mumia sp. zg.B21]MBW9210068.1 galactose mutarotase [Mumia sp. zg.B21]